MLSMLLTPIVPFDPQRRRDRDPDDLDLSDLDRRLALPVTLAREELEAIRQTALCLAECQLDAAMTWCKRRLDAILSRAPDES